jgi:PAS domain S-box-containing protein
VKKKDVGPIFVESFSRLVRDTQNRPVRIDGAIIDVTGRQRTEEALHEGREKYSKAFNASPNGIMITRARDGKIMEVNDTFSSISGFTREEAMLNSSISLNLWASIEDRKWVLSALEDGAEVRNKEFQFRIKSGNLITGLFSSSLIHIAGEPYILSGILDITERKQAEEAMQVSETRYRRLFETAQDAILILDADSGRILDVNPFLIELLGYSLEEFVGKELWEIGLFSDIAASKKAFIELRDKGYIRYEDLPLETRDGRQVNVEFVSNVYLAGDRKVIQCNIRDITGRRQAEEALNTSEQRYRRLFESAKDGILILDAETGQIVEVNEYLMDLLGYPREEFLSKRLWEVGAFIDTDRCKAALNELQADGFIRYEDLPLRTKDGQLIEVEFFSNEYEVDHTKLIQCNIRDITERKRLVAAVYDLQQEQMRVKDRFISHVSHEFRSPLASIYQFTTILLDGLAGDISPEQREHLEVVLRNVHQLRNMVDDLLEINRAAAGKLTINLQYVAPALMINGVIDDFRPSVTKAMRFSTDIPGDLPPVAADPARVREVIINLLDNAVKFTPEDGSIAVQAGIYSQDPNFICVKVSDTGCGIRHEELEKVFDYLYQAEKAIDSGRKGLGLGLCICMELISKHGGRIWVESEPGYGSTFFFTLPIFSLSRLLAPIMTQTNVAAGSIAIITVEITPAESRAQTKDDESALQEAWNAVSGCILPSKGVLLPMMPSTGQRVVFCIVLWATERDAEALVSKVKEHLEHCQSLRSTGLNPAILINMLDMSKETDRKPIEELINKLWIE